MDSNLDLFGAPKTLLLVCPMKRCHGALRPVPGGVACDSCEYRKADKAEIPPPSVNPDPSRVRWEELAKKEVLARLAKLRAEYLDRVRTELRALYRARAEQGGSDAYVCSDDAREILESFDGVPPTDVLSRTFLGSTFKTKEWVSTGQMVKSRTPGNHARLQFCWRLSE